MCKQKWVSRVAANNKNVTTKNIRNVIRALLNDNFTDIQTFFKY